MIFSKTSDAIRTKKTSETTEASIAGKECKCPFHFHAFCSPVRSFVAERLSNSATLSVKLAEFVRRFRRVCKQEKVPPTYSRGTSSWYSFCQRISSRRILLKRPVPFRAEQGASQGSVLYSLRSFSLIIFSISAFPIAPVCI